MLTVTFSALLYGTPAPLPKLNINASAISISGLSSGADFAVQFQVAFSSLISGVGVFAGQPYHCAVHWFGGNDTLVNQCGGTGSTPGCTKNTPAPNVPICVNCPGEKTVKYDHCKRNPYAVNVSKLLDYARAQDNIGTIDPLSNFARKNIPVYLYRGTKDRCYHRGSLENSQRFFEALSANVLFNNTTPSAHSWPLDNYGTKCGEGVIENCDYDGPGAALRHIYGTLKPKAATARGLMQEYDQVPFMTADNNGTRYYNETTPHVTGFAPAGNIYVPSQCVSGEVKCKLHLSLHGCGEESYYDEAVHHLGFQEWGEANNIVIMFPRIQPHGGTTETQSGCYDGYGQSGADYALKSGAQMHGLYLMIAAVGGKTINTMY